MVNYSQFNESDDAGNWELHFFFKHVLFSITLPKEK